MNPQIMDAGAAPRLAHITRIAAVVLLAMAAYAQFGGLSGEPIDLFHSQDRFVILLWAAMLLAIAQFAGRRPFTSSASDLRLDPGYRAVLIAAIALGLLLWAGTHLLFFDYALTRDEEMAVFDAIILGELRLTAAVPPEWRDFVPAMEPLYRLSFPGNAEWASAYLPGNATLRALVGSLADPALTNPILAASGGVLLFAIARRLFPSSGSAQAVALLVYFTSAQMIVNAMTPFAMTGHMALNLLWLYLFLRGGVAGHAGAGAVGFLATGLHQIIFHPLFALPFLEHLRRQSRYRALAFYLILYAATGLFWMSYHGLLGGWAGSAPPAAGSGLAGFVGDRVVPLIVNRDPFTLPLMNFNLLRFVAWQHLALVPLVICAVPLARRGEGIAQPLYWGVLLTLAAMFILLPFQSIGWGYRYLHGLLGSLALLAAYGWCRVERQPAARALLVVGTLATVAISLPYLVWQTREFIRPSAQADRHIGAMDADLVVIEDGGISLAHAQVRNDPFLRNRPLRFSASSLPPGGMQLLCGRGTVAIVRRERLADWGLIAPIDSKRRPPAAEVRGCNDQVRPESGAPQDRG